MTTVTVTLKNEHSLRLLQELEHLGVIRIDTDAIVSPKPKREIRFDAMSVDTRGFKFNREEANGR